jgi:steroid 5-alpha reductase family enzyme
MALLSFVAALLAAGLGLSAVMAAAWRIQRSTGNSGWIDVFWTFGTGTAAVALALLPLTPIAWPHPRQVIVAALAGLWSLRLGWHILVRTRTMADDPRYRDLMAQWGEAAPAKLFWQLQIQAAVGLLLAASVMLAAQNPAPDFRALDILGVIVLLGGIVGESLADHQLRQFKLDPANRGKICDVGLWRWSRHPNYFFEWLCWLAYPIVAIDLSGNNPLGPLALLAPLAMYWILVHVSGIPPLEAHMARTRGRAFSGYRARTSAFFPLPPRAKSRTG